jgi:hypothetical protein
MKNYLKSTGQCAEFSEKTPVSENRFNSGASPKIQMNRCIWPFCAVKPVRFGSCCAIMRNFRFFILLFALLCGANAVWSQDSRDVLYLKNGSVIKGEIIEHVIGESLKIQTADGSVFVYQEKDIEKMEENAGAPPAPAATNAPVSLKPATAAGNSDGSTTDDSVVVPEKKPATGWHFGFGLGSSISKYTTTISASTFGSENMDEYFSSDMLDLHFSAIVDYRFTKVFDIESGLRFHIRGIQYNMIDAAIAGLIPASENLWMNFRQTYLTLPLTFKYYFGSAKRSFFLSTGVYLDFLMGASMKNYEGKVSGSVIKDIFSSALPGVSLGAGYGIFRLNFDFSPSNVWNEDLFSSIFTTIGASGAKLTTKRTGIRLSTAITF